MSDKHPDKALDLVLTSIESHRLVEDHLKTIGSLSSYSKMFPSPLTVAALQEREKMLASPGLKSALLLGIREREQALSSLGMHMDTAQRAAALDFAVLKSSFAAARQSIANLVKGLQLPAVTAPRPVNLSSVTNKFGATHQSIADLAKSSRLPAIAEAADLVARYRLELPKSPLAEYALNTSNMESALTKMQTPWLNRQESLRSFKGFAELQGIGGALRNMSPYGDKLSALLRTGLGDWRDEIKWPSNVLTDLSARSRLYEGQGYDRALAEFPPAAFRERLKIAGLRREPLRASPLPAPSQVEDAEANAIERTNNAHKQITHLERKLRGFINAQMTRAFGENWYREHLPAGLHDKWRDKKSKAQKAGAPDLQLIEYADFTDYSQILTKPQNWETVFESFFKREESVRESFQRLHPIRLDTMHSRFVTQDDDLFLTVEIRRLMISIDRT